MQPNVVNAGTCRTCLDGGQHTTHNTQQTTNNNQHATHSKKHIADNKQQQTKNNTQQTTNDKQHTTHNNHQAATRNQQPTTNNQQPTTNGQQPRTTNQQPRKSAIGWKRLFRRSLLQGTLCAVVWLGSPTIKLEVRLVRTNTLNSKLGQGRFSTVQCSKQRKCSSKLASLGAPEAEELSALKVVSKVISRKPSSALTTGAQVQK